MGTFRRTFTLNDFTLNEGPTANQAETIEGEWSVVYFHDMERGEARLLGRGLSEAPDEAQGRVYLRFDDAGGGQITQAQVRFAVRTLQGELSEIISDYDLTEVDAGLNNRSDRFAFPIQTFDQNGQPRFIGRDRRLTIEVRPRPGSGVTEVDDSDADTQARIDGWEWQDTGKAGGR